MYIASASFLADTLEKLVEEAGALDRGAELDSSFVDFDVVEAVAGVEVRAEVVSPFGAAGVGTGAGVSSSFVFSSAAGTFLPMLNVCLGAPPILNEGAALGAPPPMLSEAGAFDPPMFSEAGALEAPPPIVSDGAGFVAPMLKDTGFPPGIDVDGGG